MIGALAEVMDGAPSAIWLLSFGAGIGLAALVAVRRNRWLVIPFALLAVFALIELTVEIRDPYLRPAIIREAGSGYVAIGWLAGLLPLTGCILGWVANSRGRRRAGTKPAMENAALEFRDSVLAGLELSGGACVLSLGPGTVHRSAGRPGIDPGEGWTQDLEIRMDGATVRGPAPRLPARISDGELAVDDSGPGHLVPVPFRAEQRVVLKLVTVEEGAAIEIEGDAIEIKPVGEAKQVEAFAGRPDATPPS